MRAAAALTSLLALTGVLLVGSPGADAATIDVTTTSDGGTGSLRAAISEANANPGPDVIQVPAGTYTLNIAGLDEDNNVTGDLDIDGDLVLVGAGAGATVIDAGGIDRVVDVQAGTTTVQSVTIANGNSGVGTTGGGGIRQSYGNLNVLDTVVRDNDSFAGGGVLSTAGNLTVRRSEIVSNVVVSVPGNGSLGGGIVKSNSAGSLTISESLIADNSSIQGNSGGLYTNAPVISIVNSTFTGNSQYNNTIGFEQYESGAVATASLQFVTIADNESGGPTGGITTNVGATSTLNLTLEGVLLQDNTTQGTSRNCSAQNNGTFASLGSNLSDDATCSLTQPSDLASNPSTNLGPLANNGGPTRTRALVPGSSAVDAASCDAAVPTDQRGAPRPGGATCDIGAFELGAVVPPATSTTTTAAPTTTASTVAPTTTSTAAPTTTSSTVEPTTTTTSVESTTTTSTIAPTTTSTAAPTTTTSTVAPTTTTSTEELATTTSTVAPTTTTVAPTTTSSLGATQDASPSTSTTASDPAITTTSVLVYGETETKGTTSTTGTLPVTGSPYTPRLVLLAMGLLSLGLTIMLSSRRILDQRHRR